MARKVLYSLGILFLGYLILGIQPVIAQNFAGTGNTSKAEIEAEEEAANDEAVELFIIESAKNEMQKQAILNGSISEETASRYTLGATDVIEVMVQRHPEVSGQYLINQEGNIQFEFVGDVSVAGMTKDEVKEKLSGMLSTYIVSPEVTVKIVGYNSKVIYVIGEVGRPGKILMYGDTITVREALVQAGLPLLSASTKKGKLFTPSSEGKPEQQNVNVYALLYEGDLRQNYVMNPGDTLYVPATGLTKVMRAISPIGAVTGTGSSIGRAVYTGGF